MSGSYFLYSSFLEKCGNFWKNGRFSGRIWPDWGNTARADMAGLGSIGLMCVLPTRRRQFIANYKIKIGSLHTGLNYR